MKNQVKTALLLGTMTGLIIVAGGLMGGRTGIIIAFVFAVVTNFFSYWYSHKIVLAMYKAKELTPEQAPRIYSIVQSLSQSAGIPMPKVYLIPNQTPNAFATGRNPENAVVAITEGIVNILDENELAGVIAHELSHIKNRDILIGSIAATLAGVVIMLASLAKWAAIFGGFRRDNDEGGGIIGLLALMIVGPIAAMLIQMAISRSREFLADAEGAKIAGNPLGLASALQKLENASARIPMNAGQTTAHLFIVNPLRGKKKGAFMRKIFSTHPPVEERVQKLQNLNF